MLKYWGWGGINCAIGMRWWKFGLIVSPWEVSSNGLLVILSQIGIRLAYRIYLPHVATGLPLWP